MRSTLLLVFLAACAVDDESVDEADIIGINPCNAATPPQIVESSFTAPRELGPGGAPPAGPWNPTYGRYNRAGIQYVAGPNLTLRLVTDRCAYIKGVTLGATTVTTSYMNGYWFTANPSTVPPSQSDQLAIDLFLSFPNPSNGQSDQVTVTLGRVGGSLTTSYSFPLVRVKTVEPSTANLPIGISESELHNVFAKALAETFTGPGGSIDVDGNTVYYDPNSIAVSLYDDASFSFRVSAPDTTCSPRAYVYGAFVLRAEAGALKVYWTWPPQAQFQYSTGCTIVGSVLSSLRDYLEGEANEQIGGIIKSVVTQAVQSIPGIFFDVRISPDLLEVYVRLGSPVISISAPYNAFTNSVPVRFPGGDTIGLVATGIGAHQYFNATPIHWSNAGPNGLPRAASFANAHVLPRTSTIWDAKPVGMLLARTQQTSIAPPVFRAYTPACSLQVPPLTPYVRFGANDTQNLWVDSDPEDVRIAFETAGNFITPACNSFSPSDVIGFQ